MVINNFPYDQKKFRKNGDNDEINEIKYEDRKIFSILEEMTDLNEKIKEYKTENIEKDGIEMKEKENKDFDDDIENEDENNEIEENEMEID